jgi:hypothetical protein
VGRREAAPLSSSECVGDAPESAPPTNAADYFLKIS